MSGDSDLDEAKLSIDYCYKVSTIPAKYDEAISSPESHKWTKAMDEEMKSLEANNTFSLVPFNDQKCLGSRWIYAMKVGPDGQEKFKARFVAKGFSQTRNADYEETFSPTARMTSVRIMMQLAVQENLTVHQMDFKSAYLNADIDVDVSVEQPEGYEKVDKNGKKLIAKLNKSLYGLKQSGRRWNELLNSYLLCEKFVKSQADYRLYTKTTDIGRIILIVWVDDLVIAAST